MGFPFQTKCQDKTTEDGTKWGLNMLLVRQFDCKHQLYFTRDDAPEPSHARLPSAQAWARCPSTLGSRLWPQAWPLLTWKYSYLLKLLHWLAVVCKHVACTCTHTHHAVNLTCHQVTMKGNCSLRSARPEQQGKGGDGPTHCCKMICTCHTSAFKSCIAIYICTFFIPMCNHT